MSQSSALTCNIFPAHKKITNLLKMVLLGRLVTSSVSEIGIKMTPQFTLHQQLAKDCILMAELSLSTLLLCNDSQYPWFILVPRIIDTKDIYQLTVEQQHVFLAESSALCEVLMEAFSGDKMNVAALGNMVPQLHIHHVVRFKNDISWPKPIWGLQPLVPYSEDAVVTIKNKIVPKLMTKISV
jgi:diadenosine tetraphosphate (Ap4A) HIT family hydrolase